MTAPRVVERRLAQAQTGLPRRAPRPMRERAAGLLGAAVALALAAAPAHGSATWQLLYDQAGLHFQRGDLEQAERFAREALREAESARGDTRRLELSLGRLAFLLRLRGQHEEALATAERHVRVATKLHGASHPHTAAALQGQAEVLFAQKRYHEAERLHRRVLAIFEKRPGPQSFQFGTALHNVGTMLLAQARPAEAEKWLRRALAVKEQVLGPGHGSVAHTLNNLALALEAQGRAEEAAKLRRRAAAIQSP